MVYSTRRFVLCLTLCCFFFFFCSCVFSPFSIAITSLGEERASLGAFCTFVRFVLVWVCRLPLPLGVWEGLRFVIVALPGLFSYLFLYVDQHSYTVDNIHLFFFFHFCGLVLNVIVCFGLCIFVPSSDIFFLLYLAVYCLRMTSNIKKKKNVVMQSYFFTCTISVTFSVNIIIY